MLSKNVKTRLIKFIKKISIPTTPVIMILTFIEKYLRKLKSEGEIQDYSLVGFGARTDTLDMDIKQESEWYRLTLLFSPKELESMTIVNHSNPDDYEVEE